MKTPDPPPVGLDHVGVAVTDLDAARTLFERLGFRLTARSHHAGAPKPGAPIEKWGSANHCAMFERGYLEVLGLTDAALFSNVKTMLARYQGLHIVALDTASADQSSQALAAMNAPVEAVRPLERDAPYGIDDSETRRARFRNLYFDRDRIPEARFIVIEHLTRDVLWQPHLLQHPNGALGLTDVWFATADVDASVERIAPLFSAAIQRADDGVLMRLPGGGRFHLLSASAWQSKMPGSALPLLPAPVGFGIRVRSMEQTRQLLIANQVPLRQTDNGRDGGIWIGADDAFGAAIHFHQEETHR